MIKQSWICMYLTVLPWKIKNKLNMHTSQYLTHQADKRLLRIKTSCNSSLNILDISPLSDIWFANILPHSMSCCYTKVFNFDEAELINLLVYHELLVSYLRNHCLVQGHENVHLCFFLSFIVLALTFRSLIHFWLIFIWYYTTLGFCFWNAVLTQFWGPGRGLSVLILEQLIKPACQSPPLSGSHILGPACAHLSCCRDR